MDHAIRAACQIIDHPEVIVVGSQAILGSYGEDQLPDAATMSRECDILPIAETNEETARLADVIEGVAGEWSLFEEEHGFGIDGVDLTIVILPDGWRMRLVKVQSSNTAAPSGEPQFIGWCLDPHDLCAAKLVAGREKDMNFVGALLNARLIHRDVLRERLLSISAEFPDFTDRALNWLAAAHVNVVPGQKITDS